MNQIRFNERGPVLDKSGHPLAGWASSGILDYDKSAIKAPWFRQKEWDWFQVSNDHLAFQMTYGHAGYAGQVGVMLFDFIEQKQYYVKDVILFLPGRKIAPEKSAEEDHYINFRRAGFDFSYEKVGEKTKLYVKYGGKSGKDSIDAKFDLTRTNPNSLVINIPFKENPKAFYYNQKVSCMKAEGFVQLDKLRFDFKDDAWGLLDWGRGVWPFHSEWYWSSASGFLDGEVLGFNLGTGFGNTEYATENCLFYKDQIHKLGHVKFELGKSYDDRWHLYDDEGRCDLIMEPVYDRETAIKLLWVDNNTHQMFGRFNGKVTLDDGTVLEVKDITGFGEHAVNNW